MDNQNFTFKTAAKLKSLLKDPFAYAAKELKEVNHLLTQISKTADQLSKTDLSNLETAAFLTAGKYGRKASDYLSDIQKMYRAGYENAEAMAELSTLAQAAGGLEAGLANDYLIAADAAYQLKGNTEALNKVLDGQNHMASRNSLSMKDLAEATKIAASQSADSGISIEQSTAAMGTMMAATKQDADIVAKAWESILMNIRQIEEEMENGGVLDAVSLREPMQVLEELSKSYMALDEFDSRRTNLIRAAGNAEYGKELKALLENWDLYEKMLEDYAEGGGSAMEKAMTSADHWEGSVNRLGNTFAKVIHNIADSDVITAAVNRFNGLLSVIDKITSKLGSFGSIGIGAGLWAGMKNTGKRRMSVRISEMFFCFEYALHA